MYNFSMYDFSCLNTYVFVSLIYKHPVLFSEPFFSLVQYLLMPIKSGYSYTVVFS